MKTLIKYWMPVLIWMTMIFMASTDGMSSQHTSRIIGPLLRWLFSGIDNSTIEGVQLVVRKCAHVSEYALLGLLVWRAKRMPTKADPRPWSWLDARWALLVCAAYAASDEFHQSFVPSRMASVVDVGLDTLGAGIGLLVLWAAGRWWKHW